jgi:hypothetical protein
MKVKIIKSPNPQKKFRVILEDGRTVDFGGRGYTDYTIHKNPMQMRRYVQRHGGYVPLSVQKMTDSRYVHQRMLNVDRSDKEKWSTNGITTAGFWSRWLLWSQPSMDKSKRYMSKQFGITFM